MSDITITPSLVQFVSGRTVQATAVTPIMAGQSVCLNAANQASLSNAKTSATTAAANGIALTGAAYPGQPITIQTAGNIQLGVGSGPLISGIVYVVSGHNDGGICPVADLVTGGGLGVGWFTDVMGIAASLNVLTIVNETAVGISGAY